MEPNRITPDFVRAASDLIREAGRIMLTADRSGQDGEAGLGITEKGEQNAHVNFVTAYDSRVQAYLVERLSALLSEATFLAEEDGVNDGNTERGYCFVIDPIDGTANFIHDYHRSAISVGLLLDGEPVFGAVLDPYFDELYTAVRGQGAFVNGKPLHVKQRALDESIIGIGTSPYYKDTLGKDTVRLFEALLYAASDVRRSGSAAIDFASVAAGRMDGFVEMQLSPWDFCAGCLLVTEAGGIVTQMNGQPLRFDRPVSVLCGGRKNYGQLKDVIQNNIGRDNVLPV